jgi:hypothetical protein
VYVRRKWREAKELLVLVEDRRLFKREKEGGRGRAFVL